ncbi:BRCT domain-containing protein [Basidiobolus meristosporus CBS 931.73]|uniref:BRCT domain-containing protein n=1 Tax=Basidiobolus meristosporus CBS 931.73 TaxID=1314790 RepID=A0A1Y1XCI4_9FUNG|nr:BRCT domain-containing protein [Basidiobolus meristosporus CBS 931.73]|eukprot:ORX83459.1 BRCT domain-containing protein [Basidiobolus meristosporus CBS 931.73]
MGTSVRFTVGKIDAGMAILLTEDNHLIEFPSLLLPSGVTSGSIINIDVNRDYLEEKKRKQTFWELQDEILAEFGAHTPEAPTLRAKGVTQTSLVLEWDPLVLYNAELRSVNIFRDGHKLSHHVSEGVNYFKISGLDMDHEYLLHIQVKTSAGTFESNKVLVKTHTIENLTGINICLGEFDRPEEIEELKQCAERIGAKWSDTMSVETTHLICKHPGGINYQKATGWNIPIVKPLWLTSCEALKKVQPALTYYLEPEPAAK